ncbi:methyltransferase-like 26 [Liolophura sinensis]|uniref:methyltransferase-like 26 n=1 Tax=Liolophura sinensis TaxID=3198878 RepID=UPI0031586451
MLQNPSAERNKGPILEVLKTYIDDDFRGKAMDFSAGAGVQLVHFASHFTNVAWQPTELDPQCLDSIKAYIQHKKLHNVLEPFQVDAREPVEGWAMGQLEASSFDFIISINLIHISPWSAAQGLFKGAGLLLKQNGYLFTYGPYAVNGSLTPDSNVMFDQSLKSRNSEWGIRDVEDLKKLAAQNGLSLEKMIDRPANNKVLVFKRSKS